ncbi:hypothetical protein [Dyadobacter sp. CY347]|nr:hypothetical protein [Dyadobacter sp. CY347]
MAITLKILFALILLAALVLTIAVFPFFLLGYSTLKAFNFKL